MRTLILGVNGQDGTLLARHLLAAGSSVVGIGRQPAARHSFPSRRFRYRQLDLRDDGSLQALLARLRPERIFHLAAAHSSAAGPEPDLRDMIKVNVGSLVAVLEHMRRTGTGARLAYASSGRVFGEPLPSRIDENTSFRAGDPYAVSKATAVELLRHYRSKHGLSASAFHLFHHESPLRPPDFFIPRVVEALAAALRGRTAPAEITSLDFHCDWGSAAEYMELMAAALERAPGEDFVLGRGSSVRARTLVRDLFRRHGLRYERHLRETSPGARGRRYRVDVSKLRRSLGQGPTRNILDVCQEMLQERQAGRRAARAGSESRRVALGGSRPFGTAPPNPRRGRRR